VQYLKNLLKKIVVGWVEMSDAMGINLPLPLFDGNLKTFEPREARRLAERLDIHYTPKHGSWLNMAEIELSVLKRQCLDRRIPDITTMRSQVAAWERNRNNRTRKIDWQFTTPDARIKLKRLYPNL